MKKRKRWYESICCCVFKDEKSDDVNGCFEAVNEEEMIPLRKNTSTKKVIFSDKNSVNRNDSLESQIDEEIIHLKETPSSIQGDYKNEITSIEDVTYSNIDNSTQSLKLLFIENLKIMMDILPDDEILKNTLINEAVKYMLIIADTKNEEYNRDERELSIWHFIWSFRNIGPSSV